MSLTLPVFQPSKRRFVSCWSWPNRPDMSVTFDVFQPLRSRLVSFVQYSNMYCMLVRLSAFHALRSRLVMGVPWSMPSVLVTLRTFHDVMPTAESRPHSVNMWASVVALPVSHSASPFKPVRRWQW